jgi:hypothetical protein
MSDPFQPAIDVLEQKLAALAAERIALQRLINELSRHRGVEPPYPEQLALPAPAAKPPAPAAAGGSARSDRPARRDRVLAVCRELGRLGGFATAAVAGRFPDEKYATIHSILRALLKDGQLTSEGKGRTLRLFLADETTAESVNPNPRIGSGAGSPPRSGEGARTGAAPPGDRKVGADARTRLVGALGR